MAALLQAIQLLLHSIENDAMAALAVYIGQYNPNSTPLKLACWLAPTNGLPMFDHMHLALPGNGC
jgi:hypothetical protein